jgi:hypothetical protein
MTERFAARLPAPHPGRRRLDRRGLSRREARRKAVHSSANGASNAAPSPTAWRKPATRCSHSRGSRRTNGNQSEPRTRSSDCTRSSSAGSNSDRAALRRNRRHAVLGAACLRTDHHAQGRRMRNDLDELLTCFRYKTVAERRAVRTTNGIERRFCEVRRRTRPMGVFQDRTSMDRILFAVFIDENKMPGLPLMNPLIFSDSDWPEFMSKSPRGDFSGSGGRDPALWRSS